LQVPTRDRVRGEPAQDGEREDPARRAARAGAAKGGSGGERLIQERFPREPVPRARGGSPAPASHLARYPTARNGRSTVLLAPSASVAVTRSVYRPARRRLRGTFA